MQSHKKELGFRGEQSEMARNYLFLKNEEQEDIEARTPDLDFETGSRKKLKVLHPHCKFKIVWNMIMLVIILYTAIILPYRFAFLQGESELGWVVSDFIVDLIFLTDMAVTFASAYHNQEGMLITDRCVIAKNYLKCWFWLDLASSIPIDFTIRMLGSNSSFQNNAFLLKLARVPRLYKLMRLVKLVRLYKSNKFVEKILQKLHLKSEMKSIIKLFLILAFLIHSIACLWYLAASINSNFDQTWPAGLGYTKDDIGQSYVASIYWAVQAITTVGFGDIVAGTTIEYLISCLIYFLGVAIYTFMISKLANLFSAYNRERNFISQKLKAVQGFIEKSSIGDELGQRILYYFQKNTNRSFLAQNYQVDDLLKHLPKNLQIEFAFHIHRDSISTIRFLQERTKEFYVEVLPNLKAVQMKRGCFVYQKLSKPHEIYFVLDGQVRREGRDKVFRKGAFFGQTDIVLNERVRIYHSQPRQETLIVEQDASFLTLEKNNFLDLVARFPDIKKEVRFLTFQRECERLFQTEGEKLDQRKLYQQIHSTPTLKSDGPVEVPQFFRDQKHQPHDTEKQDQDTDNEVQEQGVDNSNEEVALPAIDEEREQAIEKTRNELNQLNSLQNLEERIKNSDALIKTALNMVENTKQLLDSFIKLFSACLQNNSDKEDKILLETVRGGLKGLQSYLTIITAIEAYLKQRSNSDLLLELKNLSAQVQEIEQNQLKIEEAFYQKKSLN